MRKALVAAAVLASACSGSGEVIPTPSPASNPSTSAPAINSTVLAAAEETTTTEVVTTTEAPTTTEPETIPPRRTTTTYLQPVATTQPARRTSSTPPEYIKQCESGGDYTAVNPAGYYGAWQFSLSTWRSVGGTGNPADASPAEQDYRAALLWANGAGASHWSCS